MSAISGAHTYLQSGQLDQAEAICRAALKAGPDAAAYRMLAEIGRLRHDLARGLEYARRALELGPDQPESLFCRGTLLLQAGDIDGAIEHLDRAIDRRLQFDKAHDALCVALERRGRFETRYVVSVITATTGSTKLKRAIESVQAQTYPHIEHVIVVDGPSGVESAQRMLPTAPVHSVHVIRLPFNTGTGGYLCHRIYGASVYLVNGRYIAFLDDDNWFEPHHIASLMELVESRGLEWCYALRNIVDANGDFVTQDNCQSLGRWPDFGGTHLVDMNCYLLRRDIAIGASPIFHRRVFDGGNVDFRLCRFLLDTAKRFDTNGDYTVNYTTGNTSLSVGADFFIAGNEQMMQRYTGGFPWRKGGRASI